MDGAVNFYSDPAGVLIETGGETLTPAPAAAAQPTAPVSGSLAPVVAAQPTAPGSGVSCGATESFEVTSADLAEVAGCYQATDQSFADEGDQAAIWSVSGTAGLDQVVVIGSAADGTGDYVSQETAAAGHGVSMARCMCLFEPSVVVGLTLGKVKVRTAVPVRFSCLARVTATVLSASNICPTLCPVLRLCFACIFFSASRARRTHRGPCFSLQTERTLFSTALRLKTPPRSTQLTPHGDVRAQQCVHRVFREC